MAASAGRFESLGDADGRLCGVRAGGGYGCIDPEVDEAMRAWMPHTDFAVVHGSCGIRPDGHLECWGYHDPDRLNDGIGPLTSAAAFSRTVMCGVNVEGPLVCWRVDAPRVGERVSLDDRTAVDISGMDRVSRDGPFSDAGPFVQVESGGHEHAGGLCALSEAGEVSCWWRATSYSSYQVPDEHPPKGPFVDMAVGSGHACAIREDGEVSCWGRDSDVLVGPYTPSSDW